MKTRSPEEWAELVRGQQADIRRARIDSERLEVALRRILRMNPDARCDAAIEVARNALKYSTPIASGAEKS